MVVKEELKMLNDDRDSAIARMVISQDSDEALLHRFLTNSKYPLLLLFNSLFALVSLYVIIGIFSSV